MSDYFDIVDVRKIEWLIENNDKLDLGKSYVRGKLVGGDGQLDILRKYHKRAIMFEGVVPQSYFQHDGVGRRFTREIGLTNLSRKIRHTIAKGLIDIDMKNAHPCFLLYFCQKNALNTPYLEKYVMNRDELLNELMEARGITRDEAKKILLRAINRDDGYYRQEQGDPSWLYDYHQETKFIAEQLSKLYPEYLKQAEKAKKRKCQEEWNMKGSAVNRLLCDMENECLKKVEQVVRNHGGNAKVLAYDGCMITDEIRPKLGELLADIEAVVALDYPTLIFKMDEKVMNEGFTVPDDWKTKKERKTEEEHKKEEKRIKKQIQKEIDEEDDEEEYKLWKEEFELTHCKIRNNTSIAFKDHSGEWDFRTLSDLQDMYSERGNQWRKFTLRWWFGDPTMRVFQYADMFSPTETVPENAFSLWVDYPLMAYRNPLQKFYDVCPESGLLFEQYSNKQIGKSPVDPEHRFQFNILCPASEFVINHIKILCGNIKPSHEYVLDWVAQALQYPHNKTTMLAFASSEGAGKDSFLHLLRKLFGRRKVCETSRPDDIFGRFNSKLIDSLLIVLNEMSAQDTAKYDKDMKMLITESEIPIESKGQKIITLRSFHRLILFTNQENFPVQTSKSDRRKLINRCSDEKVGDSAYFDTLYKYIDDEEVLIDLFNFFMSRNVETFNQERGRNIPKTSYQELITENYSNPVEDWLKTIPEMTGEKCPSCQYFSSSCSTCNFYKGDLIEWTGTDIVEQFKYYCQRANIKLELSINQLGVRLGLLIQNGAKGLEKVKTKFGVKYKMSKKGLEAHFNPPLKKLLSKPVAPVEPVAPVVPVEPVAEVEVKQKPKFIVPKLLPLGMMDEKFKVK
jgi:hypothetical protein